MTGHLDDTESVVKCELCMSRHSACACKYDLRDEVIREWFYILCEWLMDLEL